MTKFLTFLGKPGKKGYDEATIKIKGYQTRNKLFPLALIKYLKEEKKKNVEVTFFLTEEGNKTYISYEVEKFCKKLGVKTNIKNISENDKIEDLLKDLLKKLQMLLNKGMRLF